MANEPVAFGKGGRQITLENGYIVKRVKGGKYSYRGYVANGPAKLRELMEEMSEPADIVSDVVDAATRLNLSARIETRRQAGH